MNVLFMAYLILREIKKKKTIYNDKQMELSNPYKRRVT